MAEHFAQDLPAADEFGFHDVRPGRPISGKSFRGERPRPPHLAHPAEAILYVLSDDQQRDHMIQPALQSAMAQKLPRAS
ncbi:hypothetical protein ACTMU2_31715 [Cupriavidus basilensis]